MKEEEGRKKRRRGKEEDSRKDGGREEGRERNELNDTCPEQLLLTLTLSFNPKGEAIAFTAASQK